MQKPDCDDNIERPATINECPTSKKSLFDYFFDCNRAAWIAYDWIVPQYIHNANLKFNEIFVPTADFVRISQMLNQLNNVCILEVNRIQDKSRKKKKREKQQERIDLFVESKCWDAFLCTSFSTNIFFSTILVFVLVFYLLFQMNRPLLLVGDTGTAKTANMLNYLKNLNADRNVRCFIRINDCFPCVCVCWFLFVAPLLSLSLARSLSQWVCLCVFWSPFGVQRVD